MQGGIVRALVGEPIGEGTNLFCAGEIHGEARWFLAPADVVMAREDELPNVIAFVQRGGMTFLSPVLSSVGAVVCTNGSLEAPLAILARELEIPCVMAARLAEEIVDGEQVLLDLRDTRTARIMRG
jgi:phosphohistidine swiveling domain-containing protein